MKQGNEGTVNVLLPQVLLNYIGGILGRRAPLLPPPHHAATEEGKYKQSFFNCLEVKHPCSSNHCLCSFDFQVSLCGDKRSERFLGDLIKTAFFMIFLWPPFFSCNLRAGENRAHPSTTFRVVRLLGSNQLSSLVVTVPAPLYCSSCWESVHGSIVELR